MSYFSTTGLKANKVIKFFEKETSKWEIVIMSNSHHEKVIFIVFM